MLTIVAVTYGQNESLKCFINSIKNQTDDRWFLFIIHDGPNENLKEDLIKNNYINEKIEFINYPFRTENYGHILRKWSLENLNLSKYVLLTNGDNYYTPNFVHEILKFNEDFIYFDLIHSHNNKNNHNKSNYGFMNTELICGKIDMGSVVVKSELAKKIGFKSTAHEADWIYFKDILETKPSVVKINKVLFVHN
jgi:hypothetical protein